MHSIDQFTRTPYKNRVDPLGNIIRTTARGAWLGNRGNIHNEARQIIRPYKLRAWITCQLQFKNRRRQIMMPNLWTELFFLDEATAFAAGHRPCCECRRDEFLRFKTSWLQGNPEHNFTLKTSVQEIDKILQKERIKKDGSKVVYEANTKGLPTGTFILFENQPYLIGNGQMRLWTPFGYNATQSLAPDEIVSVLTPHSIVNAFRAGYMPQIEASCNNLQTAMR